jgi:glycosidase
VASAGWRRQAVVYQISPHRFAARAASGASGLRGVISRIPYLASLGIDAVWLSPFDPSVLTETGPRLDTLLGSLDDFDELASGLHAYGIKVLLEGMPHFELLEADWDAGDFLRVIADNLAGPPRRGPCTTWILSSHGVALRRARSATLLMLALPGSACLLQDEELGLHEVTNGRPRPAVRAQERDPASTLHLHRQALGWRRKLQAAESLEWMPGTNEQVLHFGRPGGWRSVTNFGPRAVPLPHGTVIVASAPLRAGLLPADTTAWIIPGS